MANTGRARQLRQNDSWAEKLVWRWLRGRHLSGYKFRRQHPVGRYYLDFFCEEARLSIEVDGFGHGHPDRQQHDAKREVYLNLLGIQELRFWNSHLRRDPQNVRDIIFGELQKRAPHPLPAYTRPQSIDKEC
jgi:very-short-patch-repair endonuclease